MKLKNNVIIACDFSSKNELMEFLSKFKDERPFLKIGMQLFYKEGKTLVKELSARGHKIFLDLKMCDIPATIRKSIHSLDDLNFEFLTVHASGGPKMIKAACEVSSKVTPVTILTSIDQEQFNKIYQNHSQITKQVIDMVTYAYEEGARSFVCSVYEAVIVKNKYPDTILICPGIRSQDAEKDDQKRVATPTEAKVHKADYIIVGREIIRSKKPLLTYNKIKKEFHD